MKLIYTGKLGEGVCEPRSGKAFSFKRGASIEVSEKVGAELLETGNFKEAEDAEIKIKSKSKIKTEEEV